MTGKGNIGQGLASLFIEGNMLLVKGGGNTPAPQLGGSLTTWPASLSFWIIGSVSSKSSETHFLHSDWSFSTRIVLSSE